MIPLSVWLGSYLGCTNSELSEDQNYVPLQMIQKIHAYVQGHPKNFLQIS